MQVHAECGPVKLESVEQVVPERVHAQTIPSQGPSREYSSAPRDSSSGFGGPVGEDYGGYGGVGGSKGPEWFREMAHPAREGLDSGRSYGGRREVYDRGELRGRGGEYGGYGDGVGDYGGYEGGRGEKSDRGGGRGNLGDRAPHVVVGRRYLEAEEREDLDEGGSEGSRAFVAHGRDHVFHGEDQGGRSEATWLERGRIDSYGDRPSTADAVREEEVKVPALLDAAESS